MYLISTTYSQYVLKNWRDTQEYRLIWFSSNAKVLKLKAVFIIQLMYFVSWQISGRTLDELLWSHPRKEEQPWILYRNG